MGCFFSRRRNYVLQKSVLFLFGDMKKTIPCWKANVSKVIDSHTPQCESINTIFLKQAKEKEVDPSRTTEFETHFRYFSFQIFDFPHVDIHSVTSVSVDVFVGSSRGSGSYNKGSLTSLGWTHEGSGKMPFRSKQKNWKYLRFFTIANVLYEPFCKVHFFVVNIKN